MDSIIIMLLLFFGARWFNNRMKQMAAQGRKPGGGQEQHRGQTAFDIFGSLMGIEEPKAPEQLMQKPLPEALSDGESMERDDMRPKAQMGSRGIEYGGSLGFPSLEGVDICDPSLNHDRIILSDEPDPMEDPNEIAVLSLSFTKDAMMQGIVMSEILARPSARKWAKR